MNRRSKLKFSIAILLIVIGIVLAMHGSIHYRDISFLPMCLGMAILFISIFAEVGRRGSLDSRGGGYERYKILAILLGFALAFIILGVIIPLMQG